MKVSDIMRANLIKVRPGAPIGNVLIWYGGMRGTFRNTYVVDDDEKLLGVITIHALLFILVPDPVILSAEAGDLEGQEELMRALRKNLALISDTAVVDIMDTGHPRAKADELFIMAHRRIMEKRVCALPVLDEQGVLLGEVSRRMVLSFLVRNL